MANEEHRGTEDPPRYPIVTDKGLIKMVAVAPGINGALYMFRGKVRVSDEHADLHWALLEDMCMEEGRPDKWQVCKSYFEAKRQRIEVDGPLPDEYLPDEVLRRRAGHTPGRKKWTPPVLQTPASPPDGSGGPKRGKKSPHTED